MTSRKEEGDDEHEGGEGQVRARGETLRGEGQGREQPGEGDGWARERD